MNCGVRRQSEARTALWIALAEDKNIQSGVKAAAPQMMEY